MPNLSVINASLYGVGKLFFFFSFSSSYHFLINSEKLFTFCAINVVRSGGS